MLKNLTTSQATFTAIAAAFTFLLALFICLDSENEIALEILFFFGIVLLLISPVLLKTNKGEVEKKF